jgi:malate dehydrogenase (oxaloacetate-decarboxylating)(NADP+)
MRGKSLDYHSKDRPGKIELRATKSCLTPWDMRLAYLPGATYAVDEITRDSSKAFQYTSRGNLVAVITNGSAVRGMGDVGPEAAKPMQEGVAVLFKRLADIDVFDLELNTRDPDRFVETVSMLEPGFGGVHIKDIATSEGLYIHDRLMECLNIPFFYENLYSTAVVATAGLINALDLVGKRIEDVRIVICGVGTLGIGCIRMLLKLGAHPDHLLVYDRKGLLHPERNDLHAYKEEFARSNEARTLKNGLQGADVFLGASSGAVLTREMVRAMAPTPVVFALASPEPEIGYEAAMASRRDIIVATSLDEHPNAVLDFLGFPYIFRGALDVQAGRITEGMLLAAARALANLAREDVVEEVELAYNKERFRFGPEYLLPKPIDPRILVHVSAAVARQAIAEGVARSSIEQTDYKERLVIRMGTGRETMRRLALKVRQQNLRVVFTRGKNETILRACSILVDEGMIRPILLGREKEIREQAEDMDLDLGGMKIIEPSERNPRFKTYVKEFFRMRHRRGVMQPEAYRRLHEHDYFGALMVHTGDADMMMAGISTHYAGSLRPIMEVIGPAPGIRKISSYHMILLPKSVYFLADASVIIDPDAEELAEIALMAADRARYFGFEPAVAMLSFSNFGSVNHPFTKKVRQATQIVKQRAPDLIVDGEMRMTTAVNRAHREYFFPFCDLEKDANVFIFPDIQAGNLALNLLENMSESVSIGPILMGTRLPVHMRQFGITVEDIVNLVTVGGAEAIGFYDEEKT